MTKIAPFTADKVLPILKKSAQAGVAQCVGGNNQRQCGFQWASGKFDGKIGAGQQMSIVGAVSSLLINDARSPVTQDTGGTSKSDPNAGSHNDDDIQNHVKPLTTGHRVGAGILTFIVLASACGTFGWMSFGE